MKCYNNKCAEEHNNECEEYFEDDKNCEDRKEVKDEKELQFNGWTTYLVPPSRQWQKQEDIFGLFDLFCVMNLDEKGKFRLIQVRTNKLPSLKPFMEFKDEFRCDDLSVEIWVYYEKGKHKTRKGLWKWVI